MDRKGLLSSISSLLTGKDQDEELAVIVGRTLKNSGWLLLARVLAMVLAIAQSILVARALGVESYGILGMVITFVAVLRRLLSFRMNEFVIKYVAAAVTDGKTDRAAASIKLAMAVEAAASVIAFIALYLLAPLGAVYIFHLPEHGDFIKVYAITVVGNLAFETSFGLLQVFNRFKLQAVLSFAGAALSLALVAAAFLFGAGLWGVLIAYVASSVATGVAAFIAAVAVTGRELGRGWVRAPVRSVGPDWKEMRDFAILTNLSGTLSLITKDSDLLWLGFFRNPTEVGYYKLAYSLATMLMLPISQLATAIYPELSRQGAEGNWTYFRKLIVRSSRLAALYVGPVTVTFALLSSWIVGALYGEDFIPAAWALVVLLVGMSFSNIFFWGRPALLALGKPGYPMKVNVVIAALKVGGVFLILPVYGYMGNAALLAFLHLAAIGALTLKTRAELSRLERGPSHE